MKKNNLEELITEHVMNYKEAYYRLAYSYVKNADDALDIIQESICKAISSMNSLKNQSYIKTWFYRIVVNTSLDFLYKQRKLHVVSDETLCTFDKGMVDNYEDLDLQKALEALPDKYRTVIVLRYFEDLKIEEIAEILNENINTVKTHLYKSLEKLRIHMSELSEED
jgi:RNA polymerase sigma-70 factor (ECF subfamily)